MGGGEGVGNKVPRNLEIIISMTMKRGGSCDVRITVLLSPFIYPR